MKMDWIKAKIDSIKMRWRDPESDIETKALKENIWNYTYTDDYDKYLRENCNANYHQHPPELSSVIVEQTPWMVDVRTKLMNEYTVGSVNKKPPCTIYMVPTNIRERNVKAYDPQVVSIGPYHNGRHPFAYEGSTMQNYKWRCLRYLLNRRATLGHVQEDILLNNCLSKMMSLNSDVRRCYFDDDTHIVREHGDQQLALMMLLDGCFIINLLLNKKLNRGSTSELGNDMLLPEIRWIWYMVEYDLLKLENQIPFFVLDQLFDVLRLPEVDVHINLVNQALNLFTNLKPKGKDQFASPPQTKVHHLLHLFLLSLLPQPKNRSSVHKCNIPMEEDSSPQQWIPSATDLSNAGVKFHRKKEASSFLDITFERGVLEIPQLEIYDYTDTLMRNLIAFEQCYPHTKMEITTYSLFMDCIVDTSNDVKLLESKEIFANRLSTNTDVANLFNGLCNQINYSHKFNFFSELFGKVTSYTESKWPRHRQNLKRDYFSSPWTTISVIAACILLLLTMEQSFFAAYSYFRPK